MIYENKLQCLKLVGTVDQAEIPSTEGDDISAVAERALAPQPTSTSEKEINAKTLKEWIEYAISENEKNHEEKIQRSVKEISVCTLLVLVLLIPGLLDVDGKSIAVIVFAAIFIRQFLIVLAKAEREELLQGILKDPQMEEELRKYYKRIQEGNFLEFYYDIIQIEQNVRSKLATLV